MKNPKISVILASYNHAKYIRASIESVLNQTYPGFELIIWDDASTDESWEIINSYKDARIRAIRNKVNTGSGIVNRAIVEEISGDHIAIQHSDDVWMPEKLEKQKAVLDANPQVGAVFCNARIIDENGAPFNDNSHFYFNVFNQPNRSRHEWLNHFFFKGNGLCHSSVLIRRECYDRCGFYKDGLNQIDDFEMWVRLCLKYDIHILPEKLVAYRVRSDELNTSGNRPETHVRVHFELLHLYENYLKIDDPEEFLKIFPDAQNFFSGERYDLRFALAMVMLKPETNRIAKLFGLNILYSLINDPIRAALVKDVYNFGHAEFVKLTAEHDVFSVKTIQDQNLQLIEKEHKLAEVSSNLQTITQSRAWKIASFIQKVANALRASGFRR